MIRKLYVLSCILALVYLVSCNSSDNKEARKVETLNLPESNGAVGELLLVLDTSHLNMELGESLEKVFLEPFPGLPQPELSFSITRINFIAFKSIFQRHKTVLFAVPFNDGESAHYMDRILGKDVVEKIRKSKKEIHFKENVFAKNQQMIFLFGDTQKDIARVLEKYQPAIFKKINEAEEERVFKNIYKSYENKDLSKILEDDFGYKIKIPKDYKLVEGKEQFTWLRLPKEEIDYNILISKVPYSNEAQFDSIYISEWRMGINGNVDGGDTSSIKVLQNIYPIETEIISEPDYVVIDRGLWKLKNNTMGGPFVSYVKASKDRKFMYYLEGFVAAPGKNKRELVRELEVILKTFEG